MYLNTDKGYTFVEILIALLLSSIIVAGIVSFYIASAKHNTETLNVMRLDQELYAAMNIMENTIQRAGYWAGSSTDPSANPYFAQNNYDIAIFNEGKEINIWYDQNGNGGVRSDDDRFSFRFYGNNCIQIRNITTNHAWKALTDPQVITISNLQFTKTESSPVNLGNGMQLIKRTIKITLTGNLVSDPVITRTLEREILIGNDKYLPIS